MTRTLPPDTKPQKANPFAGLFCLISDEMAAVEEVLRRELRSDSPFVDEVLRYSSRLGGKRLRPALLLLSGKAIDGLTDEHVLLSAVVEMIHLATLVHDDILDDASVRRHQATINSKWDNQTSVLLGDFLFTHSFYLASQCDSTFACRTIGRTTNIVCDGELRQVATAGQLYIPEREYLQIINAKTAELCACCCLLGSYYAGGDDLLVRAMTDYGRNLGMAFQIADDVLDFVGSESAVGKSLGTDIGQRKPTLPLIHVFSRATKTERNELLDALDRTDDPRTELLPWFEKYQALEYTLGRAHEYVAAARRALQGLPDSEARHVLGVLADMVVNRDA
jgi:octaprenyl-diphosphate synthase